MKMWQTDVTNMCDEHGNGMTHRNELYYTRLHNAWYPPFLLFSSAEGGGQQLHIINFWRNQLHLLATATIIKYFTNTYLMIP